MKSNKLNMCCLPGESLAPHALEVISEGKEAVPPLPPGPRGPCVEHVLIFSLQHIVNTASLRSQGNQTIERPPPG